MHAFETWILSIAGHWWVHAVMAALALVDAVLPVVPSESVLISLASLASAHGHPHIVILALAAWGGACAGDCLSYTIGRHLPWRRLRFFQKGRGLRAVEAAERGLERRAFLFLMTARYIPVGRTAVTLVAGAVRYPFRSFLVRDVIATGMWVATSAVIGTVAGAWFHGHALVGMAVGLVVAFVVAFVVERLVTWIHGRWDARSDDPGTIER